MGRTSASAGFASWSQMQGSYRGLSQLILRFGFSGLPEKKPPLVRKSTEALEHVYIIWGLGGGCGRFVPEAFGVCEAVAPLVDLALPFLLRLFWLNRRRQRPLRRPCDHTTRLG